MSKIRKIGAATALAVPLLMTLEGYSATPYYDVAGVLTDCYGETEGVKRSVNRSKAQCKKILESRTGEFCSYVYNQTRRPIQVHELAAFCSFAYNVGKSAFKNSTLLRTFNAGDTPGACAQLHRWVYITVNKTKQVSNGLKNRRNKEYAVCMGQNNAI